MVLHKKAVMYLPLFATLVLFSWPVKGGEPRGQSIAPVSPANANGRFHFETARALYRAGEYRKSLAELELSEHSGEPVARRPYYIALNYEQLKEDDKIIRILGEFLKQSPKDEQARTLLATAQFYAGDFTGATSSARQALQLDPQDSFAYRILGLADLKMERRNEAYDAWIAAMRANPKDPDPPYLIGRLFYEGKYYTQATKWLRSATLLAPTNFRAFYYWGLSCQALGRLDDAVRLYRQSIVLSQSHHVKYSWAYGSLGKLLIKTGKLGEAEEVLSAGATEAPDSHIFTALGDLRYRQHRFSEAEAALRHAISLDPVLPDPHYTLGRVLYSVSRTTEATKEMATFNQLRIAADAGLHHISTPGPSSELASPERLPDLHKR